MTLFAVIEGTPIDEARLVFCACGCGRETNRRWLVAVALRESGMTVQEVADELSMSQGTTSDLLRRAARGEWPRWFRGHGRRAHLPPRDPETGPTVSMRAEANHVHSWQPRRMETIGGVLFRIDVCVADRCSARRACRPSGPASIPAPALGTGKTLATRRRRA